MADILLAIPWPRLHLDLRLAFNSDLHESLEYHYVIGFRARLIVV